MTQDGSLVEAEDLFDQRLLQGFVEQFGEKVISEKTRRRDGTFHFGFTQDAKPEFVEYVRRYATEDDVALWGDLIDLLVERFERLG